MKGIQEGFTMVREGLNQIEKLMTEQIEKAAPKRFIDNGDNTVTDTTTSLMWVKDHVVKGL